MSSGPVDVGLPLGFRVALDRRARIVDGGAVLIGGAPPRLLYLAPVARALLAGADTFAVTDATSAALARRLLDAGIAHPVAEPPGAVPAVADVTVVVPVRDRAAELHRLLTALPTGLGGLVVVDDGSVDPGPIDAAATLAGGRVLRRSAPRGPAAARNAGLAVATTPLVAFLDSDVVPQPGWLGPLLARFADPAVGLVAPRIVALPPITGWLAAYEAVRSALDLGPDPALVVPRSRVAYVPSAALVVRRAAVGAGFDENLHVAEDVDLVLRLHAAGWRVRYEPAARVAHDHRTAVRAWWLRKAFYGTGAAPLALRHRGAVPPMVLSPWSTAVAVLLLFGGSRAAAAAMVVSAVAAERLAHRLTHDRAPTRAHPDPDSRARKPRLADAGPRRPRAVAARLIALGLVGMAEQTAGALTRHYWPLAALACLVSARARRTVATVAVAEGVVDWWRHRDRDARVRPRLPGYLLARRLDDLGYGSGLWWGALRYRTLEPLRPVTTRGRPSVRVSPKG